MTREKGSDLFSWLPGMVSENKSDPFSYFIVGMTNSAVPRPLDGQRAVTVFRRV